MCRTVHPSLCPLVARVLTHAASLPAWLCREGITKGDVEEVHSLFHDAKFSARLLAEQADKYVL